MIRLPLIAIPALSIPRLVSNVGEYSTMKSMNDLYLNHPFSGYMSCCVAFWWLRTCSRASEIDVLPFGLEPGWDVDETRYSRGGTWRRVLPSSHSIWQLKTHCHIFPVNFNGWAESFCTWDDFPLSDLYQQRSGIPSIFGSTERSPTLWARDAHSQELRSVPERPLPHSFWNPVKWWIWRVSAITLGLKNGRPTKSQSFTKQFLLQSVGFLCVLAVLFTINFFFCWSFPQPMPGLLDMSLVFGHRWFLVASRTDSVVVPLMNYPRTSSPRQGSLPS